MTGRKTQEKDDMALPSKPAATPVAAVPTPKPAPAAQAAPHFAAGVVADVKQYGSAVDPFTGKTVTAADLV